LSSGFNGWDVVRQRSRLARAGVVCAVQIVRLDGESSCASLAARKWTTNHASRFRNAPDAPLIAYVAGMEAGGAGAADGAAAAPVVKNHNKYRKEKPWDHDGIEHWKVEVRGRRSWPLNMQAASSVNVLHPIRRPELQEWKPEFLKGPLTEESSFATLFPQYREKYLREVWPLVTAELKVRCCVHLLARAQPHALRP